MLKKIRLSLVFGLILLFGLISETSAVRKTFAEASSDSNLGTEIYIVRLNDPGVASYIGGIRGLDASSPDGRAERKLDLMSEASLNYRNYLANKQAAILDDIQNVLGRPLSVQIVYLFALNGFAAQMSPAEAAAVANLPGVDFVEADVEYQLDTDSGPGWIGAPQVHAGNTLSGIGTMGEGVVVGVLDTGINADHPSFADIGGDGYDHTNPLGTGNYLGVCDSGSGVYQPSFPCNDKLIGAWSFVSETTTPEDSDGHGSHTASTLAGNVHDAVLFAPTTTITQTISGVAPHANIISYDVCISTCPGYALLAAVNQAIQDGIDVINFSISGGDDPWNYSIELAFLDAFNAGIVVVTSAGNSGPGPSTVAHTSPWVLSTAATTHDRQFSNNLVDMTNGSQPVDIAGAGLTPGYGPALIVHAADYGDALCQTSFPANTWLAGEIVVCDRGVNPRVVKGQNVLAGGAGGMVLANTDANGESINGDLHYLPAVHIGDADGDVLRAWLSAAPGANHYATISGSFTEHNNDFGDILLSFGSRGPSAYDLLAPSIAAPGIDIWAAGCDSGDDCEVNDPEYRIMTGTSMASPHAAGSAALLLALNPTWTPDMVISALMSTSYTGDQLVQPDGVTPATPFDVGSGRVDVAAAARTGIVLQESGADFLSADPDTGGFPENLNVPSLVNGDCGSTCIFTRTLTSVSPFKVVWHATADLPPGVQASIEPSIFQLDPGEERQIIITMGEQTVPVDTWLFGAIRFEPEIILNKVYLPLVMGIAPIDSIVQQSGAGGITPIISSAHFPVVLFFEPPEIDVSTTLLSAETPPDSQIFSDFEISNLGGTTLDWTMAESAGTSAAQVAFWEENFDSYNPNQSIHGLNGWKGWLNDDTVTARTSLTESRSPDNSLKLDDVSDVVREFSNITSGVWLFRAWNYIPASSTGEPIFLMLNQYNDVISPTVTNFSTSVLFDLANMEVRKELSLGGGLPLINDQWVELRVIMDLDQDVQRFYYDGDLLFTDTWSEGLEGGGISAIAAVNLFANGSDSVYWDDMSLIQYPTCSAPSDIPWLSLSKTSGAIPAGEKESITATFDTTGLSPGKYLGSVCINSNDVYDPLISIPVMLDVE